MKLRIYNNIKCHSNPALDCGPAVLLRTEDPLINFNSVIFVLVFVLTRAILSKKLLGLLRLDLQRARSCQLEPRLCLGSAPAPPSSSGLTGQSGHTSSIQICWARIFSDITLLVCPVEEQSESILSWPVIIILVLCVAIGTLNISYLT